VGAHPPRVSVVGWDSARLAMILAVPGSALRSQLFRGGKSSQRRRGLIASPILPSDLAVAAALDFGHANVRCQATAVIFLAKIGLVRRNTPRLAATPFPPERGTKLGFNRALLLGVPAKRRVALMKKLQNLPISPNLVDTSMLDRDCYEPMTGLDIFGNWF